MAQTSDSNLNYSSIATQKSKIMLVLQDLENMEKTLLNAMHMDTSSHSPTHSTTNGSPSPADPSDLNTATTESSNAGTVEGFTEHPKLVKQTPMALNNASDAKHDSMIKQANMVNKTGSVDASKINALRTQITSLETTIQKEEDAIQNASQPIPDSSPSNIEAVNRLKTLAQMRIDLLEALLATYVQVTNNSAQAKANLVDQLTLQEAASQNIINAQKTLNNLMHTKTAHQRLAEINTYYAKEYAARTGVMKVLVFTCVPLLILALLKKKKLLPGSITNTLSVIIFVIGLIVFVNRIYDLSSRNNMNYDEYDFEVSASSGKKGNNSGGGGILAYDKRQLKKLFTNTESQIESDYTKYSTEIDKKYHTFMKDARSEYNKEFNQQPQSQAQQPQSQAQQPQSQAQQPHAQQPHAQ